MVRSTYYVSVFSGIEAATVAWAPLGWMPVCFSEIDPFPSAVLKERFPSVPNLGDITKIDWSDLSGFIDVVVGGSPCQSFSVAGRREGLDGASGLMWEWVRCVRELMPRWVVWENVPGALSSGHGEDFRCLLRSLDELGYGVAWRVLDSQFFGVAQRRRRVFLVGCLGAEPPVEVLFEPEGLRRDHPTSREKREALAARAGRGPAVAGFKFHQGAGAGNIGFEYEQSPTCTADWHNPAILCMADDTAKAAIDLDMCGTLKVCGSAPQVVCRKSVRRLTPRECERLQGLPDDWTLVPYRGKEADECPDGPRYKAIGNSMAVPVMGWIGKRIQGVMDREETEE